MEAQSQTKRPTRRPKAGPGDHEVHEQRLQDLIPPKEEITEDAGTVAEVQNPTDQQEEKKDGAIPFRKHRSKSRSESEEGETCLVIELLGKMFL